MKVLVGCVEGGGIDGDVLERNRNGPFHRKFMPTVTVPFSSKSLPFPS